MKMNNINFTNVILSKTSHIPKKENTHFHLHEAHKKTILQGLGGPTAEAGTGDSGL